MLDQATPCCFYSMERGFPVLVAGGGAPQGTVRVCLAGPGHHVQTLPEQQQLSKPS